MNPTWKFIIFFNLNFMRNEMSGLKSRPNWTRHDIYRKYWSYFAEYKVAKIFARADLQLLVKYYIQFTGWGRFHFLGTPHSLQKARKKEVAGILSFMSAVTEDKTRRQHELYNLRMTGTWIWSNTDMYGTYTTCTRTSINPAKIYRHLRLRHESSINYASVW